MVGLPSRIRQRVHKKLLITQTRPNKQEPLRFKT